MRLLHTSDLHLGKRVYECSMLDEQEHILEQIVSIAKERAADAVLLSGDLYDKTVPPVEAVTLLDRFLTSLSDQGIPVFLISGNHDSAERLSFGGKILEKQGLYFGTEFTGVLEERTLKDEYGKIHIYLLPFVKPAAVRKIFPEEQVESYEDAVRLILQKTEMDPDARNVLLAHQLITDNGTEPERCDSETVSVGGVEQVDYSLFSAFDYVALGHLHGPQSVGRETVRYSGSPLKYSFSEWRQKKSVTLVTLGEKGSVELETVPLTPRHDMREIRGKLDNLIAPDVVSLGDPEDYLRVILTNDAPPYDAIGRLRSVYRNVLRVDLERAGKEAAEEETAAKQVENKTMMELFSEFYQMANGAPMTEAETTVMETIMEELEGRA